MDNPYVRRFMMQGEEFFEHITGTFADAMLGVA
jgi:hypothetical protein